MEERRIDFNLYLITDRFKTRGRSLKEVVTAAYNAGVKAFQLREKDLPAKELFLLAEDLRKAIPKGKLFINDRLDIALGVGANGVHLGRGSFSPIDVKRVLNSSLLVGVSTHSLEEALEAEKGRADFITFGPVFYTPSKAAFGPPLGLERLREVVEKVDCPVFAIGGIKKENIRDVIMAGAYGVALISAIMEADDIESETRAIIEELEKVTSLRIKKGGS